MKIRILTLGLLLVSLIANAQTKIFIPRYVKMPKDSLVKSQIITDLNNFLTETQKENSLNKYVLPSQKVETYILVDEFKGVEKSRGSEHFFKPYLNNVVKIDSNRYLVQISHIGIKDSIPYLKTMFNLIAHHKNNSFLFSSPLIENSKRWKTKIIKNFTFKYKDTLNIEKSLKYVSLANEFDKKLKSNNKKTILYCAKNRTELLRLIGVEYKLDYNGRSSGAFSALNENEQLIILGNDNEKFDDFDPHDLWHDRLSLVISRRKVNKHVDEACAYFYGGSWGLSWNEIFNLFMQRVVSDKKDIDWMYYKENRSNFADTQAEHLMVDYVVTALIVKKIERKKGFEGVWRLLNSGKYEKGNEKYFKALDEIIGVNKKNYNKEVWKLIKKENK